MKKSALPAALLLLGIALPGCPVYDDNSGCYGDYDCDYGYVCDVHTGACVADGSNATNTCQRPSDCGTNETCSRSGTCVTGDCSFSSVGCVRGYECSSDSGRWECVKSGTTNGAGGAGGAESTSSGGAAGAGMTNGSAGEPNQSMSGAPAAGGVSG